jgi:uncharacterized protein YegJ (DUF2314 family)
MLWIVLAAVLVVLVGFFYLYRRIRRRESRLVAFVALLREPMTIDPAVLAKVAGKVWNADLGDGTTEGEDGFVAGIGEMNTIMHDDRIFLVNSFPQPYVEEVEEVAEQLVDARVRQLFLEHKAWFSCDAMGVDGDTPAEDVGEHYRRIGKLFAELLDENCLLIFLPDTDDVYPVNEDTEAALRSADPLNALDATMTVPVIQVADDDPLMVKAVEKAKGEWAKFVSAFEGRVGTNHAVKAPVTGGNNTEFIWITVTAVEGGRIYGKLANAPGDLGPLKLGSKVTVNVADLNDWCYLDAKENIVGGFTIEVVRKAALRKRG